MVNAGEHADRVERDERVHVGADDPDQRHGQHRQHDDPVGEDQPLAALHHPPRQERVLGDEAGQEREAVEAGVAAGVQDQRGRRLHHVEHEVPGGPEHDVRFLRDHGREAELIGGGVGQVRQPGDAGHQRAQDQALRHQDPAGVEALGGLERADGVGDRLDAGQGGTPVGERLQQREDDHQAGKAGGARADCVKPVEVVDVLLRQVTERLADDPDHDHQDDRPGEQVGGQREDLARLPDAAQVAEAHQQDDADGYLGHVGADGRERRGDGRGARRDLHRHRDHVVDQQRHGGDLRDPRPEVVPGDHVGPASPGVDDDDLAVEEHHEQHDEQDHRGHRHQHRERGDAEELDQLDEDFLGAVGRGGDAVRGQHAQREKL